MAAVGHIPVLFHEVIEHLAIKSDGTYLDATCGAAGHSKGILERLGPKGRLVCLDQDPAALEIAGRELECYSNHKLVQGNFSGISRILDDLKIEKIDGALADIGVSSMQFDRAERGFSFDGDVELDMRMDPSHGIPAVRLLEKLSDKELAGILKNYGEQPMAGRVAKAIRAAVEEGETITGRVLRRIVHHALPAKMVKTARIDPATRVFMALRIAVNDELAALESFLEGVFEKLAPGGRLVIISFHSLEDRIVKGFFRDKAKGCVCPKTLPKCICGQVPTLEIVTRKPVVPGEVERQGNSRARSAKLRAAEKLP